MHVGFIGLGNVGGKLAGSLLRNGFDLTVRDLDPQAAQPSPRSMAMARTGEPSQPRTLSGSTVRSTLGPCS